MAFFIYLLEQYAGEKNLSTSDVLATWNSHGITQVIFGMYEMYHAECLENAFEDIDSLVATGQHAW